MVRPSAGLACDRAMWPARLATLLLVLWLPLGGAGPALGATSQLMPTAPGLSSPASAPRPVTPAKRGTVVPSRPAPAASALPHTGIDLWVALLVAAVLLCAGTAIRAGTRRRGTVRLEPVVSRRR